MTYSLHTSEGTGGRLADKVAIVTGAGSGIGRAAAVLFAAEGATVALFGRTAESGEDAACESRRAAHREEAAEFHLVDVANGDQVDRAIRATVSRWGRLDIMFNAAGVSGRGYGDGPVADCTEEGWHTVIDTNLTSMFLCCKYGVMAMLESGGGSIINLSSVLGLTGGDENFCSHAYAASKGGIIAMTRAIASYYAPRRIRANVIAPALIRTKMSQRAQDDERVIAALPRLQPLTGDFGAPDDVAEAAVYLASDASSFVTGVVLPIDGGWTAR